MTDYPPNKLVAALAKVLVHAPAKDGGVRQGGTAAVSDDAITDALAGDPSVPELVTFAGFLGGSFKDKNETTWRFLYLDPKLVTWLVVNQDDIVLHRQLRDVAMPTTADYTDENAILRDLIWLKTSASVTEGSGPPRTHEIEAQFLRGDFIGAGDFSASLAGGTFSRATGLLCEVQTPGCCGRYTRPRP